MLADKIHLFAQPQRQSPIAILFILGRVLRILVRQSWIILLALFTGRSRGVDYYLWIFFIMASISGIASVISYFRYYFYIADGELIVERGILQKARLNIPLDRIQSIRFKQGILHRFFGVVELELDTSGSKGSELELRALDRATAEALQDYIETQTAHIQAQVALSQQSSWLSSVEVGAAALAAIEGAPIEATEEAIAVPKTKLFSLDIPTLIKVGLSQNPLRMATIFMVFLFTSYDELTELMGNNLEDQVLSLFGLSMDKWYTLLLLVVPLFVFASFLVGLVGAVFRYYNFTLWRTKEGFLVQSGLITRQDQMAILQKIQIIRWKANWIQRQFALWSVYLAQASSQEVGRRQSIEIVGSETTGVHNLIREWLPTWQEANMVWHGISPLYIYRRTLFVGLLPLLFLFGISLIDGLEWIDSLMLLWLPFQYLLSRRGHEKYKFGLSVGALMVQYGVMTHHRLLIRWHQIQAVSITQSPFEYRRHIAKLHVSTAAGTVTIPYLPLDQAEWLRDAALMRVETSRQSWM